MTVLVIDDDASIRRLIRRVIGDHFDIELVEADDGLTGLQYLLEHRIDLVVLDLWMPVIGGLETLETIRRSSSHADMPVMLMSGKADEAGVQRALRLGVKEIIAKPFSPDAFRQRFAKLVEERAAAAAPQVQLVEIGEADTALIVDTSAEFLELAKQELRRICHVEEAPNEFAALSRCLAGGIDVMLVGATSEMSSTEVFGRKLRGIRQLRGLRTIAAVPEEEPQLTGLYDATVVRSFVPGIFHGSLVKALQPQTLGRLLFHPASPALGEFCDHVKTTFRELIDAPIDMHVAAPGMPGESVHVGGAIEVQGSGTGWDVRVACTMSTALRVGSRLCQRNIDELSDADSAQAVVRLAERLGQQLKETMAVHHLQIQPLFARGLSEVAVAPRDGELPPSLCRRWFSLGDHEMARLEVLGLGTHAHGQDARAAAQNA